MSAFVVLSSAYAGVTAIGARTIACQKAVGRAGTKELESVILSNHGCLEQIVVPGATADGWVQWLGGRSRDRHRPSMPRPPRA